MIKKFFSRPANRVNPHRWGPWHCASYSFLALAGLIAFNLAGCGGGGGNSNFPPSASVRIDLRNPGGNLVGGTVRLRSVDNTFDTTLAAPGGSATFSGVRSGNYLVTVTYDTGTPTTQTDDITVGSATGSDRNQTFVAVQGVTGVGGAGIQVTGRIFSGSPTCGSTSLGLAAKVLVRVRKLDPRQGNPIVATSTKPFQGSGSTEGNYGIFNIPGTGTYIVEVRQAPADAGETTAPFCGQSASFFVPSASTVISNIDICVNAAACRVGSTPPAPIGTPIPTTGGGGPGLP